MAQPVQLTLRTLLAYLDDTLEPALARQLGAKVAESELARGVVERIKRVTRRRGLQAPAPGADDDGVSDPNTVAEYLSDTLDSDQVTRLEETCLQSDAHLAEVAACHQILSIVLTEPVRVPPRARQRMYGLVGTPGSIPNRRPGATLPVGGVAPPDAAGGDADDADAALLLGLGRYAGGSFVRRAALVGAAAVLAGCLAVAVVLALPRTPPGPPETSPATAYAAVTPPTPAAPTPPAPPAPPPAEKEPPKPPDKEPAAVVPPPKPKENTPEVAAGPAKPRADRSPVGKVEGLNVVVLTRADDGPAWLRLDPADEAVVTGQDQVLCLPGYKAYVQLDTGVKVHLWGNVPEQLPARLLEARVRFHVPERKAAGGAEDFDADVSLLAGRVYLTASRPAGARVRVRAAGEVWDVTLPDAKTDVAVEVVTAFEPGAPFVRDGGAVRVEVQAAVTRGAAGLAVAGRAKPFDKVAAPAFVAWDNKSKTAADPKPVEPGNGYFDKFFLAGSDQGRAVQKALTDQAVRLKARNGVMLILKETLTESAETARPVGVQVAVYAQAAVVYGATAGDDLKLLIDVLTDEARGYARLTAVNALAAWVAQAPGNTELLDRELAAKIRIEGTPELVTRLLRGVVDPAKPDPAELDRLAGLLDHPSAAVRELVQWNLINFVDPEARRTAGMVTDVAAPGPTYDKYAKAWRARIEEVKKRPPPK